MLPIITPFMRYLGQPQNIIDTMELGIEIPERVFSYLGNVTRSKDTMHISLPIFREGTKRYPHSPAAEYYLARALLKTDKKDETILHLKAGISKANNPDSEYLSWFESQLKALQVSE